MRENEMTSLRKVSTLREQSILPAKVADIFSHPYPFLRRGSISANVDSRPCNVARRANFAPSNNPSFDTRAIFLTSLSSPLRKYCAKCASASIITLRSPRSLFEDRNCNCSPAAPSSLKPTSDRRSREKRIAMRREAV